MSKLILILIFISSCVDLHISKKPSGEEFYINKNVDIKQDQYQKPKTRKRR